MEGRHRAGKQRDGGHRAGADRAGPGLAGPGRAGPHRAGPHRDARLRLALGGLLVALVAVALAAGAVPRPKVTVLGAGPTPDATPPATAVAPARSGPLPAGTSRLPPGAPIPPTTAPTVPPGQRGSAGHGCGLGLAARPVPGPVGHCTVLEIGDSLGSDLGWGLARCLGPASGLDLVQADKASTGLANSAYWNWPVRLAGDLSRYHPQLVLVSLGGNDEQGLYVDGAPAQFPSPAWRAGYLARVRLIVHEATAAGAYVLWVGMPVMQQPQFSQGMEVLDSLYQQGTASDPNAAYVSVWQLFADPDGQFAASAEVNGSSTSLRQPDGVHYSFEGEDVIATYVLDHLATIFHVRVAPLDPAVITGWS